MFDNERLNGYCQEQLWYLAFKHKMNNNVGNHDQEQYRCSKSGASLDYTPYAFFDKNNIVL